MNLKLKLLEMKNKKVLVVLGGNSGERKVSLESGRACIKALKKMAIKYQHLIQRKTIKFNR